MAKKKANYTDEDYEVDYENFYAFDLDEYQTKFKNSILNEKKLIVFCNAKAGTGKTQIAIGAANMLYHTKKYNGIVCVTFPCSDQRQGYLPGDITQKSEVYFEPIYQAMIKCGINPETEVTDESISSKKFGTGYIKLLTSTYLRGTNFENKIVIIDEAQNGTIDELKKVLTRCADSCKVIITGHTGQIDLQNPRMSGFSKYIEHFKNDDRCSICELVKNYRGWISSYADELT